MFVPAARALDVRAVFAFPLVVGAAMLGALNVHRRESTSLDARATRLAFAFADLAVELLLDAGARVRQDEGRPATGSVTRSSTGTTSSTRRRA